MISCRLCDNLIDDEGAIVLKVPAGTQLFSDDAAVSETLKTNIAITECPHCSLIQLSGSPVAYDHVSSSSSFVSDELTHHRLEQLRELINLRPRSASAGKLLEIGCGDGHLLEQVKPMFEHSVGIEPTQRNAKAAADRGLDIHQMLMARDVTVPDGPFQYFCSFHVLEHVTQVRSVLQGVAKALDDEGVGIVEVPCTEAALENQRFGDFMPDHLNYFTEQTLRAALEWSGFSVVQIYRDWGGEHLVAYVRKRGNSSSLAYIEDRKSYLAKLVENLTAQRLPVAIWGVSHHLMPYMPVLAEIDGLLAVDGSSSKVGKYIPSTNIPVKSISTLRTINHGYVLIAAPRFKDEILLELKDMFKSVVEDPELSKLLGFGVYECQTLQSHKIS